MRQIRLRIDDENIKAIYPFKLSVEEFKKISSVQIDEEKWGDGIWK